VPLSRTMRLRRGAVVAAGVVLVAAGCGAEHGRTPSSEARTEERRADALGPRYGVAVTLPAGWDGRLGRGALHAASFRFSADVSAWVPKAGKEMSADDVIVSVFENEPRRGRPLEVAEYPELPGPLRLDVDDFEPFDGITEDSRATGHGYARRTFQVAGRFFVLFAESGTAVPSASLIGALNELLGSFAVEPGDFYPGTVGPARFAERGGWFVGTSGVDDDPVRGRMERAAAVRDAPPLAARRNRDLGRPLAEQPLPAGWRGGQKLPRTTAAVLTR
jgi:hypothetical protein